jgi:hypothetical protein
MSQTAVLKSLVKTDNEYQGMYRHDISFENDPTTYIVWRSNDRPISFKPGDTVNFEVTDVSKKKIKFLKSPAATQSNPATQNKPTGGGFKRSADTNRSIMAQTCLKASTDFFKDRQNASLEDVADGTEYLLSRLEALLSGDAKPAPPRPAIPTDFLDKLPN